MIHTTCLNSAVFLSSSLADPTYFFDPTFQSNPLLIPSSFDCCCCCCCCCANRNSIYNGKPRINPRFLYNGIRQSTLIQFSPCKRVTIHGRRRRSCYNTSGFSSISDSDRNYYYEKLESFKQKRKLGGLCRSFEDKREEQYLSNGIDDDNDNDYADDVEIMLSLLTAEVGLENIDVSSKKWIDKNDSHYVTRKTRSVGSGVAKRDSNCGKNVVEVRNRAEDDRRLRNDRREEERGAFEKRVNRDRRKDGSSCSSYYSVSSTGEFESENDVELKQEYKDDRKGDSFRSYDEEVEVNVERRRESGNKQSEILKKYNAEGYSGNEDWRKKSEKKLNEELGQHQSRVSVNIEGNRRESSEKVDRIADQSQSRMKYKRFSETSERDNRVIESSSSFQMRDNRVIEPNSSSQKWDNRVIESNSSSQKQDNRVFKSSLSSQKQKNDTGMKLNALSWELSGENQQDEYRRQSNLISKVSGIQEIDLQEASSSSSFEARMKNREEDNSVEVSGQVEDFREENHQKTNHSTSIESSRMKSQQISGISDTRINTSESTSVSRRQSEIRTEKRETSSFEEKVIQQVAQRKKSVEEKYLNSGVESVAYKWDPQTESAKTGRKTTKASSFHVGMLENASKPYKALKLNPESRLQESGSHGAGSSGSVPVFAGLTHEHSSEYFKTITGEPQEPTQEGSRVQESEILEGETVGDAIDSAGQQQQSSSHFVGEFIQEAKNELSASEVQLEKKAAHEAGFVYEVGGKDGSKGPSDEMWHETGAPDNISTTGNGESDGKTGRSLWNIIGDIVRIRWASPRSEAKSGVGKGSSNQSTSSEAWFSGHEHEESNDENVQTGSTKGRSRSQKETSSNANKGSSSKSMSPSVIEESSFPSPAIRMRRSPVVKKSSNTGEVDASGSGKTVKPEQPVPDLLTEPSPVYSSGIGKTVLSAQPVPTHVTELGSEDGELKRRKFGRKDQVSKDRFDEWEEAYTFESRQRKNDEYFMREALVEAKKAADFWEVPVGAVLVQDGKVIARGYNLVEELRDSTAHAEMICIREASNNLRSWRLSGTTLYVTLEPCPMCAGAILQARIDTVVWGAPNKLLGADGSWIRLFPDGDGGTGSDKPAAPVHPFHQNMTVRRGVLSLECADVMQQFFQLRRKKKTEATPSSSLPISHHHRSKFFTKMHDAFNIMFCL